MATKLWMTALAVLCLALQGAVAGPIVTTDPGVSSEELAVLETQFGLFKTAIEALNNVANPTQARINAQAAKVAALFCPYAVLIAGDDNDPKTTKEEIKAYFARLLMQKPTIEVIENNIRELTPGSVYCSSGTSSGTLLVNPENPTVVSYSGRGSFCWRKVGKKWFISQLHSSNFFVPPGGPTECPVSIPCPSPAPI